jgi:predicted O-methyltransferase YrrM
MFLPRLRDQHHKPPLVNRSNSPISIESVLAAADALLPEFLAAVDAIPEEERGRGIFLSEMFLFYCVVRPLKPRQILESGRALGGSTLTLAHCFPDVRIVSVELDAASSNNAIALNRLAPYRNVECLFGDSREILPRRVQSGDAVLIDGPKEFRALKLALNLLRTGKPSVVFLHDCPAGSRWRKFIDDEWPDAFFSDHPEFLRRFSYLDDFGLAPRDWRRPRPTTFACLPGNPAAAYRLLLTKLVLTRALWLAPSKIRAVLSPSRP